MNTEEINARFAELQSMCEADERYDLCEQLRQWIYRAEGQLERAEGELREIQESVYAFCPAHTVGEVKAYFRDCLKFEKMVKKLREIVPEQPRFIGFAAEIQSILYPETSHE